ncbi:MAG: hypothetical protein M3N98_07160 [Actinomycetota bacterium]|nr:hypothetical protein [Actinomycetota bacterium]
MSSEEERHDERLRRWAKEQLPCYSVEGWDGERRWSRQSGTGLPGGQSITLSVGVALTRSGGGSVEVDSYRQDDDQFRQLRAHAPMNTIAAALRDVSEPVDPARRAATDQEISRLQQAARNDQLAWEGAVIGVDGRPTIFCVAHFGAYWTAIGRGPDVDLILAGHNVAVPRGLVRLPDSPPPLKIRPHTPPHARAHRFPDDSLAPVVMDDIADSDKVDISYRDRHRLVGTVAGTATQLDLKVPAHDATASGTFAGVEVHATWNLGSNSATHPDVPGSLTGAYAGQPVALSAVFHLDDDYIIDYATIGGDISGQPITGRLETADGGIGSTGATVWVEGLFAGTEFSLFVTIASGYRALVRGQVGGKPVELDAKGVRGGNIRVAGRYQGPHGLLAVIVVTLLHFL